MRSWQTETGHLACRWSEGESAFTTIRVGCKSLQIFRVIFCLPFRTLPATVHSGEQPLGSSSIPLNAIPSTSRIQTEALPQTRTANDTFLNLKTLSSRWHTVD